jgi:protein HOOK3
LDYYRDAAYQNLRRTQVETTQKLDQERVKRKDLEAEVKSQARELLSVRTDCQLLLDPKYLVTDYSDSDDDEVGAVEKDSVDALEVLKQTDQLISSSLQSELDAVRKEVRALQLENDQQKSQLIEALLSKERLRKEMDEETRVTPAPTPAPSSDAAPTANPAELEEALRVSKAETEKLRDAFKRQKEVSHPRLSLQTAPTFLDGGLSPPPHAVVRCHSAHDTTSSCVLPRAPPPPEAQAVMKTSSKKKNWLLRWMKFDSKPPCS